MNLPPYGDQFRRYDNFFSTLNPSPTDDPSMKVQVTPGGYWLNSKTYVEYRGGVSSDFIAPGVNSKICLLVLNHSGNLRIIDSEADTTPSLPECPENTFPICAVYLKRTDTKITNSMIYDIRGIYLTGTLDHNELTNLDAGNCHPISSITNLQSLLDNMPTHADVRSELSIKCDTDGTPNTEFVLNKDHQGPPVSNVAIKVERGDSSDVYFGWNEEYNCWEYNNGDSSVHLTNVGPSIVFPPATTTTLGGIIVGDRLTMGTDGVLDATLQSDENFTLSEKEKLVGIEPEANKYIHPETHQASMIIEEFGLRFMTDSEKSKLGGIEPEANKYIHPTRHTPDVIIEDPSHRFVTDLERDKLSNIEDGANYYEHPLTHSASTITEDNNHRFVTDDERIKLSGIAESANNYVHPTFHPATMITQDSTHRFVTDVEVSEWNNKASIVDIDNRINALIGSAPTALDTLQEIATALDNNEDFASTVTSQLSNKVDKSPGFGLSQESFTTVEKSKLATIADFANNYIHPDTHPASMIDEDASHRFITDVESVKIANLPANTISELANKVTVVSGKQLSDENYTLLEKNKLADIDTNANNYTHPATHPATMIQEDGTHRFVTDTEVATWNNKDRYVASNPAAWSTTPTTVQEAIDMIADVVYTLNGNVPI